MHESLISLGGDSASCGLHMKYAPTGKSSTVSRNQLVLGKSGSPGVKWVSPQTSKHQNKKIWFISFQVPLTRLPLTGHLIVKAEESLSSAKGGRLLTVPPLFCFQGAQTWLAHQALPLPPSLPLVSHVCTVPGPCVPSSLGPPGLLLDPTELAFSSSNPCKMSPE